MRKVVILVLCMSLFFSVPFVKKVQSSDILAPKNEILKNLDPMDKVLKSAEKAEKKSAEKQKEPESSYDKDDSLQGKQEEKNPVSNSYELKLENGEFVVKINSDTTDSQGFSEKIIFQKNVNFSEDVDKLKKNEKLSKNKNQGSGAYLEMVEGFPMEDMVPAISKKNREVASFLIAIAKKESNWGKYSPSKEGRDCYNYWGYRGSYNQTDSGYSCFDTPEQAVEAVGERIQELIDQEINTPERMIVWKCGSSCAGHDPYSVKKWIADVDMYYKKLNS